MTLWVLSISASILLTLLKVTNLITWSWLIVFSPVLTMGVISVLVWSAVIYTACNDYNNERKNLK